MTSNDKRKTLLDAAIAYAAELRTEIERQTSKLKRELDSVEQFIRGLAGSNTQDVGVGVATPALGIGGKYDRLGPQAAVEQFLKEHREQSFRPAEMASQLKAQGFSVPNPKLATQQVAIALARAVAKGLAIEEQREGRRAYQAAPRGESETRAALQRKETT